MKEEIFILNLSTSASSQVQDLETLTHSFLQVFSPTSFQFSRFFIKFYKNCVEKWGSVGNFV